MSSPVVCPACAACPACPKCPECPPAPGAAPSGSTPVAVVKTDAITGETKVVVVPESEVHATLAGNAAPMQLPFGLTPLTLAIIVAIAAGGYWYFNIRQPNRSIF